MRLPKLNNFGNFRMGKLTSFFIIILSIVKLSRGFSEDDNNPYYHIQVLDRDGKYVLEWSVDWEEHRVNFNVTVKTKGYVGFGLSRKGKMSGADIVIGGVYPDGTPYFTDRHAIGNQLPVIDDSQDWTLHAAQESNTHTFLSFSRPFETCDENHDLPINSDVIALIWAIGEKDNELEYHYGNRGSKNVYLLDPDLTPRQLQEQTYANVTATPVKRLGDWNVWSVPVDTIMPQQDTAYLCTFHKAPSHKSKQHIVGFRTIFNSEAEERHIHHFVLHVCNAPYGQDPNQLFGPYVGQPGKECYILALQSNGIPTPYCMELKHEWAVGAGPVFFPDHVGATLSESPDQYYMLQVHYDNPQGLTNFRIQFQTEVYYTDKLRKHDAGLMVVGHIITAPSILLPPSETNHVIDGHCASQCTRKMFPKTGVNVVATKLHTHLAGKGARLLHIQGRRELPLTIDDNFDFNFQPFRILRKERKVLPGDTLIKRCYYDTTDKNGSTTVGGFSTRNEMCLVFMWYYPYIRSDVYGICSSEIRADAYRNFLGIFNTTWSQARREFMVSSPPSKAGLSVTEATNLIDWTIDKRAELQTHHSLLPPVSTCPSFDPNSVIGEGNRPAQLSHGVFNNLEQIQEAGTFSDLDKEIINPRSDFISRLPIDLVPYQRSSRCVKYKKFY